MYNLGIPSSLKAWIDHVVRVGRNFFGMVQPDDLRASSPGQEGDRCLHLAAAYTRMARRSPLISRRPISGQFSVFFGSERHFLHPRRGRSWDRRPPQSDAIPENQDSGNPR